MRNYLIFILVWTTINFQFLFNLFVFQCFLNRAKPEKGNTFSLFECIASTESARRNRLEFTSVHPAENEQDELKKIAEKFHEQKNPTKSMEESVFTVKLEDIPIPATPMVQTNIKESITLAEEKHEATVIKRVVKPKTELEIKIASAQGEHPSKKKDIFKAIFDSDSENDSSEENDETNDDSTAMSKDLMTSLTKPSTSSAALYAQLPDDAFKPKSAREINILRNTSPPRGIFSGLTRKIESTKLDLTTQNTEQLTGAKQTEEDLNSYGPSLPPAKVTSSSNGQPDKSTSQSDKSSSLSSISLGKTKIIYEEKWIEKSSEKEKKSKKEKKHKKDKHKSKKPKKDKDKHKKKKR